VGTNDIPMEILGLEGEGEGAMEYGLQNIHGDLGEVGEMGRGCFTQQRVPQTAL